MHNILKSQNLSAIDSAGTYCFPNITKETGLMDGADPKSGGSSFQRIFVDMTGDRSIEIPGGSFVKSSFIYNTEERIEDETACKTDVQTQDEPIDYQKIIQGMMSEAQQKEAEAYQKGIQDGHTDGFQQGHQAGVADGLKEIETMLGSLQQAMNEINTFRKSLSLQAERETVRLSLAIAGKILLQEPAINPGVIADVVKKTFETIAINAPVRIRINPSELSYMQARKHLIPIEGEVTFIEDASISCGGCVVESFSGDIDARIESQLKMVEESFLPGLEKNAQDLEMLS